MVSDLDGGVADALPVHRALEQGCDRVVLVMTKPAENLHPMDYRKMRLLLYRLYGRRYPALYEALMTRANRYFTQLEEILALEKRGEIFVIRPTAPRIRSLEKDRQKMRAYYAHGAETARKKLPAMREYLQ